MRPARPVKKKISILIADREGVFRLGLNKLFGVEDDLRIVGQAEGAEQTLAGAKTFKPDVIFLQAEILAGGKSDLVAQIRRHAPRVKIVLIGPSPTREETDRYLKSGVAGLIEKSADPAAFVKCARRVSSNESWNSSPPSVRRDHKAEEEDDEPRPLRPAETLTRQEKIIIGYLMQGCRNREIARQLSITEQTVKNHLRMIYDKVGVSDRLELVLYAIHKRLELPVPQTTAAAG